MSLFDEYNYQRDYAEKQNNKLKKLKQRKKDLEAVGRSLVDVANTKSSEVNSAIKSAVNKLVPGIKYSAIEDMLDDMITRRGEGDVDDDIDLSCAVIELKKEINNVNNQIDNTESKIQKAKNKAKRLKSQMDLNYSGTGGSIF